MNQSEMSAIMARGDGFIAALDQSGGSTPKALAGYGIEEGAWGSDEEMFDLIHQMRSRIIYAPCFGSGKVIGAILFERTMDGQVGGKPTPQALIDQGVVPFIKIDKGLEEEANGVQMMKPMPTLIDLLTRAKDLGVFGRFSWNDGQNEILSFTDVDRGLSGGVSLKGTAWKRPDDTIGFGGAINGLSEAHRNFLAAGGLGLLIGDGALNYREEKILETYYAYKIDKTSTLTADYQFIDNPAYNAATSCLDNNNAAVGLDERGAARPYAALCDVGAYEFDGDYIFANGSEPGM